MAVLQDRVAVITGGTRGFGLAIAQAYAQEGARVVVGSRSTQSVQRAVQALQAAGAEASGIATDVRQRQQVEALAQHAVDLYGGFDIWVNNAGLAGPYGPTVHVDPELFLSVLDTNIRGTYYGSIIAMRHFLPKHYGKLINVLGRGARKPTPNQNAYASSKAWMRSFTLALAEEYEDSGVGIFAYSPGLMETQMMEDIKVVAGYEQDMQQLETVMRMWANPPSVPAQRAVWLASPATDGKTGKEIYELSPLKIIAGLLKEGLRRLTGQPAPERPMHITTLQPEISASGKTA